MVKQSMANFKHKVLIAAGIYPPDAGGPAVHAKKQFEELPKLGLKTGLVAFRNYRVWPKGIRHFLYFLALAIKVPFYDVVYAHDALGVGLPALCAARLFGKKFILRIGGDVVWEREAGTELSMNEWYAKGLHRNNRMFKLCRFVLRHADMVATTSPIMNELYKHYYGVESSKIKLLANPFPKVGEEVVEKGNTIIFASRLTAYKNLAFVFDVLAEIFPKEPELKFIIMGDGPEKGGLEKLSRELGIQHNIVFIGSVPLSAVLERTAKSLFVIAPALTEFNPNYVLQGISYGKPFLISREHGLPFAVPEELTFNPRNSQELREKIESLLEPAHYAKMAEKVAQIDFKMSWEDNLTANYELIMSL